MLPRFHLITDFPVLYEAALGRVLANDPDAAGTVDAVQVRAKQANDRDVVGPVSWSPWRDRGAYA